MIVDFVKTGHVAALNPGDMAQLGFAIQMGGSAHDADDLEDRLFPFADDEDVDKGSHWFGIVASMTTSNNERVAVVSVNTMDRHARQINEVDGVGVKEQNKRF